MGGGASWMTGPPTHWRDQVVGLDASSLEDLEAEQRREPLDLRQLPDDVLRGLVALGLILRQDFQVTVRSAEVEEDGATVRLLPFPEVQEGLHPAVQRARGELVGLPAEVGALHREVTAEDQIEPVDEQPAHGRIVAPPIGSIEKKAGPPCGGPVGANWNVRLTWPAR